MYVITDQQGDIKAIATRKQDAEAMLNTLNHEPTLVVHSIPPKSKDELTSSQQ